MPNQNSEDALDKARRLLNDAIERNIDRANQSAAQLDRTLITLSAGALVFSMTFVSKLAATKCILTLLFSSWICFLAAIILVILAMRSQQNAIERAANRAASALKLLEDDPDTAREFIAQQKVPVPLSKKEVIRHEEIGCLNSWALVAFGAGILLLAIFAAYSLYAA